MPLARLTHSFFYSMHQVLESPEDQRMVDAAEGPGKVVEHLTPDQEVLFWETRAGHMNDIWDQLTGARISKVLDFLAAEQSTYAVAFQKTMREVAANREEANDNLKYLLTLSKWFSKLNEQDDFAGLPGLFKPIVHTILLVWKNSDHYNKPMRLVVLIRMICNAIINQAMKYVSGSDAIFGFLEDEEFAKALETLKLALKVCSRRAVSRCAVHVGLLRPSILILNSICFISSSFTVSFLLYFPHPLLVLVFFRRFSLSLSLFVFCFVFRSAARSRRLTSTSKTWRRMSAPRTRGR